MVMFLSFFFCFRISFVFDTVKLFFNQLLYPLIG